MRLAPILAIAWIPAQAALGNPSQGPSAAYVEKWLASPDTAGSYAGVFPRFRFTEQLAAAVADQDRPLVAALLPLLAQANQAEILLLRLELGAARQQADAAQSVADEIEKLVRTFADRPAAGSPAQIERETIAGSALRLGAMAATARVQMPAIERRLKDLGAEDLAPVPLTPPPELTSTDPEGLAAASPVLKILEMLSERHLSTLTGLPHATLPLDPMFQAAGDFPEPVVVRLGGSHPLAATTSATLHRDQLSMLKEAIARKLDAIAAQRRFMNTLPDERLRAVSESAALAGRQFQQGAISPSLFLEAQQNWIETMEMRNKALISLWREVLDLGTLTGSAPFATAPSSE